MSTLDHVMKITHRPPIVMVEGSGSWLRDSEGRRYLDFVQGWAVNCLGHGHPVVLEALQAQARRLINCSPAYDNEMMGRLATLLAGSSGLDSVFLCNSGAEANEGAIKLARKWGRLHRGGAFEIVTTHGAFHGRTLATMSASGKPAFEPLFEPKVPGFRTRSGSRSSSPRSGRRAPTWPGVSRRCRPRPATARSGAAVFSSRWPSPTATRARWPTARSTGASSSTRPAPTRCASCPRSPSPARRWTR